MANINETINNIEKVNPELAEQVRKYVKDHSYGLVYEQNLPDAIRLYKKKVQKGDTVNILPTRGELETKENSVTWVVNDIDENGVAYLNRDGESTSADLNDLVTLVDYHDVIYPGLKEIDKIKNGEDSDPYQVVLNAENYHALEALGYMYNGKVDCIYIDPPYNTGAKDWKYNNDYVDGNDQYRHSKWLTFMERRLKLAKQLLNPTDSVLIVTIDEKEYNRLGLLLNQIFPGSRIQMVSSLVNPSGVSRGKEFYRTDEYIYFVKIGDASPSPLRLSSEWMNSKITGKDKLRWRPIRRQGSHDLRSDAYNEFYPIFISKDGKRFMGAGNPLKPGEEIEDYTYPDDCISMWPIRTDGSDGCWQISRETFNKLQNKGYTRINYSKKWGYTLQYLAKGEQKKVESGQFPVIGFNTSGDGSIITADSNGDSPFIPGTQWSIPSHSAREYGSSLIKKILLQKRFSYPKSLYAVHDTLRFFVEDKPNALIIDFFAGSGTTLHAVNLLNSEDGGKRQCICVTNNEVSTDESEKMQKHGLRPGDKEWDKYGIAEYVTWPRTKYSIMGKDVNGNTLKGDYGTYNDEYVVNDEDSLVSKKTGKPKRGTIYKKEKIPDNKKLSNIKLSDGFHSNAVFYELTYENAWPIRLDKAFNAIAPILWMQSGSKGRIINKINDGYDFTDYYGVLFDYSKAGEFCKAVKDVSTIKTVFVVTDDQRRYSNIVKKLPNVNVNRLYESYLKTFQIYGEGRFD